MSVAGSSVTKAYLEVTAVEDQPPPIITMGPANQTLPINTVAILPCQASGEPKPTIGWFRNGNVVIDSESSRTNVKDSGTLIIDSKSFIRFSWMERVEALKIKYEYALTKE